MLKVSDLKFQEGLIPAIVQDQEGRVRMLGWMNRESLDQTLATGWVCFWSRSRQRLWVKGETSGHRMRCVEIRHDCDRDALLLRVLAEGPTCHEGIRSCFDRKPFYFQDKLDESKELLVNQQLPADGQACPIGANDTLEDEISPLAFLAQLESLLQSRRQEALSGERISPSKSYTQGLFARGLDRIAKKVCEEAGELILAAKNLEQDLNRSQEFVDEAADLLFHTLMLLVEREIPISRIVQRLKTRHEERQVSDSVGKLIPVQGGPLGRA